MSFAVGYRRGKLWEDTLALEEIIRECDFNASGKGEREFEIQTAERLKGNQNNLHNTVVSQYHNDGQVTSAYFFGKKHRPDLSLAENGTAIELKFVDTNLNSVKHAIGQALIYRLYYKFAVLIFVISSEHKELYEKAYLGHESHFDGLLENLENEMNVFTILKPAFKPRKGLGETISFFPKN